MKLSTILVGVDFSPESRIALEHALDIARRAGARVVLVHVSVVPQRPESVPDGILPMLSEYERILRGYLAEDRRRLAELCARCADEGVDVSAMILDDLPDRGICKAAAEVGADLVMIGTHGRAGVKRLLLGSVAERVVRLSGHDVLVARPGARPPGSRGYRRILVAMDFSPMAEAALRGALSLAAPDACIDMLHCKYIPALAYGVGPSRRELAELTAPLDREIRARGDALVARYTRPGLSLAFHTIDAEPMQGIIEWHDRNTYDLAVVGSHGNRGLRRFLLGSVAEAIVRHASTPVLVVHQPGNAPAVRAAALPQEARI
jgi:nucleotide-binding universal stress UspA family protein